MPRKKVVPDLDQFRPPSFDLKRYNWELKPRTPAEWHQAMRKRLAVLGSIDGWSLPERGDSRDVAEKRCRRELPEVFGDQETGDEPPISDDDEEHTHLLGFIRAADHVRAIWVKDLTTFNALVLFQRLLENDQFVRTALDREEGNWNWFLHPEEGGTITPEQAAAPVLRILDTCGYLGGSFVPVEVNLRAPDAEIKSAFARWLESARETYGVPQPRPEVLNKKTQAPVITQAMLHDWHRDQILPFLDLYLWNRLYNPPPCEGLWRATTPGRFSYQGATWTFTTETWMKLIGWDDARTFRRDILGKALKLLDRQIIDLLGAFARRNPEPTLSKR